MSCHVIWCGGHVIWCDVIACVVSCHVMQCDHGDELYCVVPCNGMECSGLETPLVVRSLCVLRSGSVTLWWSKVLLCTTKYCSVLQSTIPVLLCTTKYYNVLLQYYSVLQSTTTQNYKVLLQYLLCTTLYYKVLLQFCYFIEVLLNWTLRVFKTSYIGSFLTKLRLIVDMIEFSNAIGWIRIIFRSFGHLAFGRACLLQKTFFN